MARHGSFGRCVTLRNWPETGLTLWGEVRRQTAFAAQDAEGGETEGIGRKERALVLPLLGSEWTTVKATSGQEALGGGVKRQPT